MRIDAHQHFWHYVPDEYGWIDESMAGLRRDFLPDDRARVEGLYGRARAKMISVLDYGAGNVGSVIRMVERAGGTVQRISSPDEVLAAKKLLLPGVGAFDYGMAQLASRELLPALNVVVPATVTLVRAVVLPTRPLKVALPVVIANVKPPLTVEPKVKAGPSRVTPAVSVTGPL